MKLFKTLGVILFAVALFTFSGCTTNFCSEEDVANIKTAIKSNMIDASGTGYYAQPDATAIANAKITIEGIENPTWNDLVANEKADEYVDYVYNTYHPKACLVTEDHADNSSGGNNTGTISKKNFSYAFKQGLLEILAFPVSFVLVGIGNILGGSGIALMFGVFVVTFAIRTIMLLATWKSTQQSQRLQMLQPEINAIQAKYANKNDPQSKNQRAMEIMNLYKKNKVNPLSSMIAPFLTLPVFIAIYSAVKDTTLIYESQIAGTSLGAKMSDSILSFNWLAIVTFILMVGAQFLTMKLPQWLAKRNASPSMKAQKTGQQMSQQSIMTYFFLIMIVVISWMLPIAMSIYWIASSLYSIIQSLVMRNVGKKKAKAY